MCMYLWKWNKRLDTATEGGVKRGGPAITDKHMTRD